MMTSDSYIQLGGFHSKNWKKTNLISNFCTTGGQSPHSKNYIESTKELNGWQHYNPLYNSIQYQVSYAYIYYISAFLSVLSQKYLYQKSFPTVIFKKTISFYTYSASRNIINNILTIDNKKVVNEPFFWVIVSIK